MEFALCLVRLVCFFDGCFSVVFSVVFFFVVGRLNLGIPLRRNSDLQEKWMENLLVRFLTVIPHT